MGLKVAVASGNWSNPAIWNGGVLPNPGDIVASNNFTVTIDQNINVDRLTNAAETAVSLVPIMTGYTTPSGIASASREYSAPTYAAWKAFDGSVAAGSNAWVGQNGRPLPEWLEYEFSSPQIITGYSVQNTVYDGNRPTNWEFQAWNGTTWVVLDTVTGSPSQAIPYARTFTNTVAYSKYRIFITNSLATDFLGIGELRLFDGAPNSVAGGGFILNDGVTVTCTDSTSGIRPGTVTCLTYPGTISATINANVIGSGAFSINKTGNGTLNIIGTLNSSTQRALNLLNNTGTTNIIGNVVKTFGNPSVPTLNSGTGNTINITGNLSMTLAGGSNGKFLFISEGLNTITITGNIDGTNISAAVDRVISITTGDIVNITGNVLGVNTGILSSATIFSNGNAYLKIIGSISAGLNGPAIINTFAGAINIFTGPFISSSIGIQPLHITRMHYQRTMGSYYEFRDNSTLGALPPSPSAPATRLVSPDTVADSPVPRDVRLGTIYAEGSQTGTMIVPSRDNVAKGVLVDNTVGTAILDADSIWAVPLTSINTLNSIGRRVKNAATVETTGAQIQQTLNDNE